MQWWDGGEATLTAFGEECNYTVECEFGRNRLWKVTQTLDSTLLKATWADTADAGKALAEGWEAAYVGPICTAARSGGRRIMVAARTSRPTRQRLARSQGAERKSR